MFFIWLLCLFVLLVLLCSLLARYCCYGLIARLLLVLFGVCCLFDCSLRLWVLVTLFCLFYIALLFGSVWIAIWFYCFVWFGFDSV